MDSDNEMILWWDGRSIWMEWFNIDSLPYFASDKIEKIIDSSGPIRDAFFYPNRDAIIASFSNSVAVIEIDGRGGHVQTALYKGKKPNIILPDSSKKIFYILDDGNIIRINLL